MGNKILIPVFFLFVILSFYVYFYQPQQLAMVALVIMFVNVLLLFHYMYAKGTIQALEQHLTEVEKKLDTIEMDMITSKEEERWQSKRIKELEVDLGSLVRKKKQLIDDLTQCKNLQDIAAHVMMYIE